MVNDVSTKNNDSLGEQLARRLAASAYRTGWGWSLLNLAWSAGPVTFLALFAGSYLGLGKAPSIETFLYFAVYTLVAGMVAAVISFVRHQIIQPRIELADQSFMQLIDRLFNLHFTVRDFYVQAYDISEQPRIAAWWPLSNASADLDTLQEAVRDLTGDDELARGIKRIEIYRRNGFVSLMKKESHLYQQKVSKHVATLQKTHPIIAAYLEERFEGKAPTLRHGQLRNTGFLSRCLEAANHDKPQWLSVEDMLSAYTLTLEVLLGRSVLTLHPVFNDSPKLEEAKKRLDEVLSDFRLQRRKRNSHLRLLVRQLQILAQKKHLPLMGLSGYELFERAQTLLNSLELDVSQEKHLRKRYQLALDANKKMKRYHQTLKNCEKSYNKEWENTKFTDKTIIQDANQDTNEGVSLQLEERFISLTDKQKLKTVEQLNDLYREQFSAETVLSLEDCQQFAMECINALDEVLNISEPEEQMALEESRQADFGCIEPGLTAATKLAWGHMMVQEVQETRAATVHRLAKEMIRFFNVPLSKPSIKYLVEHYGASEEHLQNLAMQESEEPILASIELTENIHELPNWQQLMKR